MRQRRRFGLIAVLLFVAGVAAACYLPDKFIAEIRLGKNGDYALHYIGDLTWAPLYRDIKEGRVPPEKIQEKIDLIEKDLKRDTNFTKVESLGDARFRVEYERQGRLAPSEQVTFVRRNAIILMIRSHPDGRITVDGNTLKPSDAQMATTLGLGVEGEFRVVTDGYVKQQNASQIKPFGPYRVYIWTIQNAFSPSPHFVMQREGAWPSQP